MAPLIAAFDVEAEKVVGLELGAAIHAVLRRPGGGEGASLIKNFRGVGDKLEE